MRTPTASFISVVSGPSRLLAAPSVDISRRSVPLTSSTTCGGSSPVMAPCSQMFELPVRGHRHLALGGDVDEVAHDAQRQRLVADGHAAAVRQRLERCEPAAEQVDAVDVHVVGAVEQRQRRGVGGEHLGHRGVGPADEGDLLVAVADRRDPSTLLLGQVHHGDRHAVVAVA